MGVRIPEQMLVAIDSQMRARLVILLFAPVQWGLFSCIRWLGDVRLRASFKAVIAALLAAISLVGTVILQAHVYRSLSPVVSLKGDNYFFSVVVAEELVSVIIVFMIATRGHKRSTT